MPPVQTHIGAVRAPSRRLRAAWLLVVCALLLTTRPGSTQPEVVTFAAIGDFGDASAGEGQVADLVKSWNPDFVITLGDNNYEYGSASTIDANIGQFYREFISPYVGSYGAGGSVNRFFPALGNHDWGDGFVQPPTVQPHYDYFALPGNERYYDYVQGPLHMFVLDSDPYEPDGVSSTSAQAAWLEARLAASTALYKIVYFHHAAYSSGVQNQATWMRWPFRAWGVTAVLAGHHHHYEASLQANIPYFVNGLGGAGPNQTSFPTSGSLVRYRSALGAMRVTASDARITFDFVNTSGTLVHRYAIDAPTQAGAPNQLVATGVPTGRIDLWWRDNAADEDGYVVERATDGENFIDVTTLAAGATSYSDTSVAVEPTPYQYRVRVLGGSAAAALSNVASAASVPERPTAPTLSGTPVSSSRVRVTWAEVAGATGVRVYRLLQGVFIEIGAVEAGTTEFVDTGRAASTTYTYLARAFNAAGESPSSNTVEVTTSAAPGAPTNLTAVAVSSSQVNLAWTDTSADEQGFMIQRSVDGGPMGTVAWAPANATSYANTGRAPSTTYTYQVRAYHDGAVTSEPSGAASATTLPLPAAPSNLAAASPSSSQVDLTWNDNSTTEDTFRIFRSTDGVTFGFLMAVAANVTSASNTGLQPSTSYWYRVVAREAGGGESAPSNVALVGTGAPAALPAAPAGLTATGVSSSQVNLAWTDASSNETGFRVERSTDGTAFSTLAWVGAGVTAYAHTGRPSGSTLYYRVVAYNGAGTSAPSNVAAGTTLSALPAPAQLTATATSATRVQLAWTDTSSGESGFRVYRSTDGVTFTLLSSVGANVTSYANTSALPATTYAFRVMAYDSGGGQSSPSNTAQATTPDVPAAPTNLVATALSSTQIGLTWTDNASGETGYRIDRSTNGVTFSTLAWVGANVTSYVNGGRQSNTTYYYRVAAYDANGSSAPSATASATTP